MNGCNCPIDTWTVAPRSLSASTVIGQSGPGNEGTNLLNQNTTSCDNFKASSESNLKALMGTQSESSGWRWAEFSVFKAHLVKINQTFKYQLDLNLRRPALPMLPLMTTSHILMFYLLNCVSFTPSFWRFGLWAEECAVVNPWLKGEWFS